MYKRTIVVAATLCFLAVSACQQDNANQDSSGISSGGAVAGASGQGSGGVGGVAGSTNGSVNSGVTPTGGTGGSLLISGGTGAAGSKPLVGNGGNSTGIDAGTDPTGGATAGTSGSVAGSGGATAGIGGSDSGADSAAAEAAIGNAGTNEADASGTTSQLRAVIVRAAEVPPGDPAKGHPDAISTATPQPYNTFVFTEILAEKLTALGVTTEALHYYECAQLSCVAGADILVLASPNIEFKLLIEITNLVPYVSDITPAPGVCSGLASTGADGSRYIDALVQDMSNRSMNTIPPVAIRVNGPVLTEADVNATLESFAKDLVNAVP